MRLNAKTAKRLRRKAKELTDSLPENMRTGLTMKIRRIWNGDFDEKGEKVIKTLAGTIRHKAGTYRRVYKDLKAMHKNGVKT